MYRPLPDYLVIQRSPIEGSGLYARRTIPQGHILGISHYLEGDYTIRTPLGGFYNHSEEPNCVKVLAQHSDTLDIYLLKTIKDIKAGEEITVKYTLYKIY